MTKITEDFRISALRRGIIVRANRDAATPTHLIQAAVLEMANLGFLVKPEDLSGVNVNALIAMMSDARKIMGADRDMTPIYPGFPKQVEDLATLTLLVEQILHYWTAGAFLPDYPTIAREGLPLEDMLRNAREVRVLSAAATAREFTLSITTSPVALSEDDRALLEAAIELQHPNLAHVTEVAKLSRNGENLQSFVKSVFIICDFTVAELVSAVAPACDSTDQLLRTVLAVASAPADAKWAANYSLAVETLANRHFRAVRINKLSRPTRRVIIDRVGALSTGFKADGLVGRRDLWRSVMRAVHPYDFKLSESQKRAADIIHSNDEYRTLNSLVEAAMETGDVSTTVELLAENQPGNLLRRVVALLRLVSTKTEAEMLAAAVRVTATKAAVTTLISSYNGIISANDENARVTRVAGLTNTMIDRKEVKKIKVTHLALVSDAIKDVLRESLKTKTAPAGAVAVVSAQAVPLVRRDASTSDRVLDRGQELDVAGEGANLRIFGHWNNNQSFSGYMDIGVTVLDENFQAVTVCTWNAWMDARDWSTYSGDKNVYPGDSAAEFIDVKLGKLRKFYPDAKWAAMTVQSWSGWPMGNVDFIAGAMLRSSSEKGEVFDARTVTTAFKPTTQSTQSVPFVVNLETGKMVWLDSSNGSIASGVSSKNDDSIGGIVYDELARPRFTMGELATLWAEAHGAEVTQETADRDQLLALLS